MDYLKQSGFYERQGIFGTCRDIVQNGIWQRGDLTRESAEPRMKRVQGYTYEIQPKFTAR
jgi:hypothetical protein